MRYETKGELKRYIFQTLGYSRAHIEAHMRCALKESTLDKRQAPFLYRATRPTVVQVQWREGTVSCLRHPLQDDGANDTTAVAFRSALATVNQPS